MWIRSINNAAFTKRLADEIRATTEIRTPTLAELKAKRR